MPGVPEILIGYAKKAYGSFRGRTICLFAPIWREEDGFMRHRLVWLLAMVLLLAGCGGSGEDREAEALSTL